ncbi:MAG: radical SAM family heme chaperone HemW [Anaerolineae bacterium]|nr:radical SAM family heme chaperone HemW [Anaerolineae bacterium]
MSAGLYLHIPFCRARCTYCDFNTYAGLEGELHDYVRALLREIESTDPVRVQTIYFGGGTPTLLPLLFFQQILNAVHEILEVVPGAEVTVEANPGTVDSATLSGLRALGVNRLSLGVQSFRDEELALLGRIHNAAGARSTIDLARKAGFDNLNLDLIYGLPHQPLSAWRDSLEQALALDPAHLSLYALSIEPGTPLAGQVARGLCPAPDPDLAAEMYDLAEELCAAAGYVHYEISNWVRGDDQRCRHNLIYWRNEPCLGLGAGAHSWRHGKRRANVAHPSTYAQRLSTGLSPVIWEEEIDRPLEMGETMMMGLRLLDEGVSFHRFQERFKSDLRDVYSTILPDLTGRQLVEFTPDCIRLTPQARLIANQAFYPFLPE